MCVDFLYNFCLKYFSFIEEFSEIWSKMGIGLHVKYPLLLAGFNKTWNIRDRFSKNNEMSTSWKSVEWGPICFHADRHHEENSSFSQFWERAY
jgi:hypothetical protein